MACAGALLMLTLTKFAVATAGQEPHNFAQYLPNLESLKGAWTHLREDSNESYEDQAKEQIAAMLNSVKTVVKEEEVDDPKPFLAKGQTCKKKCKKEMSRHLGNTCEHMAFRLKEAEKVDHAHMIESAKNALKVCKQSEKHHAEYCKWKCWREDL
ncbi:unnamed protein product [Effrenium voratum]|nr:unnamed protein product [Effrenium voratum]